MLRVRTSLEGAGGCASGHHSGHSSISGNSSWCAAENESGGQKVKNAFVTNKRDVGILGASSARGGAGENALEDHRSDFSGNSADAAAHASAGYSKGIIELHEVKESVLSKSARVAGATATAGESGIDGLLEESESDFPRILPSVLFPQVVLGQRMRLQVRVMKSLDLLFCLSWSFHR